MDFPFGFATPGARLLFAGACIALAWPVGAADSSSVDRAAREQTGVSAAFKPEGAARPPMAAPPVALDEYRIGAHDLIEVSVFQVPDLTRTVRVNAGGKISLPLIGAVEAGGLSAQELERKIAELLAKDMLQDPQVTVFIKEYVSQRVVIEGSVVKAGVYPLTGRTTLLQAIAMAQGLDSVANENEIKIFRHSSGGGKEVGVFDLELIRAGKAEDPVIMGNDMIVVEKSGGRSVVKSISDTIRGIFSIGVR